MKTEELFPFLISGNEAWEIESRGIGVSLRERGREGGQERAREGAIEWIAWGRRRVRETGRKS